MPKIGPNQRDILMQLQRAGKPVEGIIARDDRPIAALLKRGMISDAGGKFSITDAGRAALASQ